MTSVRFRHPAAERVALLLALIGTSAVASQRWWLLPLLLIPLLALGYALRAGVDADAAGLTVRALAGRRRVAWAEVTGLRTVGRRVILLTGGQGILLPAVRPADVPRLVAASGGRLERAAAQ